MESAKLELKFRIPGREKDIEMKCNTKHQISKIKTYLRQKMGKDTGKVRLFFNGKELNDDTLMGHHGVESGYVLQVHAAKI